LAKGGGIIVRFKTLEGGEVVTTTGVQRVRYANGNWFAQEDHAQYNITEEEYNRLAAIIEGDTVILTLDEFDLALGAIKELTTALRMSGQESLVDRFLALIPAVLRL
jgi:hypothetical protein